MDRIWTIIEAGIRQARNTPQRTSALMAVALMFALFLLVFMAGRAVSGGAGALAELGKAGELAATSGQPGASAGPLLPYCAYEVAAIIEHPGCGPWSHGPVWVTGLNEKGEVSGYYRDCEDPGIHHAFYWTPQTGLVTIDFPSDIHSSRASAISDTGIVVGSYKRFLEPWRGFVYDINAGELIAELEPVVNEGSAACWANAINNDGIVVGARSIGDTQQPYNAFIWTPGPPEEPGGGTYEDLGVMNGNNSSATDLNEIGHVTGWTGNGEWTANALGFVYIDNEIEFIEPVEGGFQSASKGINILSEATGDSRIASDQGTFSQAFHWIEGVTFNIGNLPDFNRAFGHSINDEHAIVGTCRLDNSSNDRACLWYADKVYDINDFLEPQQPSLTVRNGRAIAENGAIAANGLQGGTNVGVVLTPIERPLGDLTGDCTVGLDDLLLLLSEWGKTESPADLNKDGLVDGADLGILLSNWTMP